MNKAIVVTSSTCWIGYRGEDVDQIPDCTHQQEHLDMLKIICVYAQGE